MPPEAAPVTTEQIPAVAGALARGFQDNEAWEWIIPDPKRRARLLETRFAVMIEHVYIPRGGAWSTPDAAGGALWTPPGRVELSLVEQLREAASLFPGLGIGGLRRGSQMSAAMKAQHPTEPHYYLDTLSIDPPHQRRGYGSALIAPMLERADAEGMPAYLETQRRDNIPFYRRFGFEETGEIRLSGGPSLWAMWREPALPR